MMTIDEVYFTKSFIKDLKGIKKSHKSITKDFDRFLKSLLDAEQSYGAVRVSNLGENYSNTPVWKVKAFRCSEMKGKGNRSGFRIIYIEYDKSLIFVQFYYKDSDRTNHDSRLIKDTLDRLYDGRLCEMVKYTGNSSDVLLSKSIDS